LIFNLLIGSIQSITFQYYVNLIIAFIIFWMKIDDVFNGQNKKLAYVDVRIN